MTLYTDQHYLRTDQYADGRNLSARIALHERFSTRNDWFEWVFDHFPKATAARVLELGCGTGALWKSNAARIPEGWAITLSDFSEGMVEQARQSLASLRRPFSFRVIDAQTIPFPDALFDCGAAGIESRKVSKAAQCATSCSGSVSRRGADGCGGPNTRRTPGAHGQRPAEWVRTLVAEPSRRAAYHETPWFTTVSC